MKICKIAICLSMALMLCTGLARGQTVSGQPPLSDEALAGWLTTFKEINNESSTGGLNLALVTHLSALNDWIRTQDDIRRFREWKNDDEIVRGLIPLAAGLRSETRSPATLVLGNVVDNTNVCYVIAYLANTPDVGADGQYNLLQVIRQVAGYAFSDTAAWIQELVELKEGQLKAQSDVENTARLLDRIKDALGKRTNGQLLTLRSFNEPSFKGCVAELPAAFTGEQDVAPLFQETIADLTTDLIRQRLFSDQRREYATHLAMLYDKSDEPGRAALVKAVVDAIIPQKEDPERRYRVNLYVAVAFTRMASGALKDPVHQQALLALRQSVEYRDDPTFAQNVNQAIAKQGL
ncbi:hypothetical protein ACFSQQ_15970 [Mesorhizobium kowhaii]|uniref:hypothetical protein n=1 Tax=Mesorhizobium kowhaii TaxID=1300272 RepID=UPI0035EC3FD0